MSDDSSEPASGVEPEGDTKSGGLRTIFDSKKTARNFGSPWRAIVTAVVIFVISQIIAGFLVSFALSLSGGDDFPNALENNSFVQFSYVLIAEALAITLVWAIIKRRGLSVVRIGLGRRPQWGDAGRALMGILAFYALIIVMTIIITRLLPGLDLDQPQDVGFKALASPLDQLLAFTALVIFAPIGEEVLVRGYLYSALRSRWSFITSMIVTSLLFGAAHLGSGSINSLVWGAGLTTLLLSVVLVYLREKTGALYAGIIVHAFNNLIAFGVYFREVLF